MPSLADKRVRVRERKVEGGTMTNADLIAEADDFLARPDDINDDPEAFRLVGSLTDALEQAESRLRAVENLAEKWRTGLGKPIPFIHYDQVVGALDLALAGIDLTEGSDG